MDALNGIASSIRITKDSCHFAQYYSRVSHGVHLGGPQMYSICIEVHDDYVPQPTAAREMSQCNHITATKIGLA